MACALEDGIDLSNDYSFFSKSMQASWAGGSGHWKPRNEDRDNVDKRKKIDKAGFMIDFEKAMNICLLAREEVSLSTTLRCPSYSP